MSENEAVQAEPAQVTFVGGKAIEQTESLDSGLDRDSREEAKAAVRKAIQEAGESSAKTAKENRGKDPFSAADGVPERGTDGKFLPKDAPKEPAKTEPEEELDLDKASVKQLLKARERVAAIKREGSEFKGELAKERQELASQQADLKRAYQEIQALRNQVQRDHASMQALKSDPARAIRELGYDPEQYIIDLAQEGTPEGQAKRQHRELQAQIKEMQDWKTEQLRQTQNWQAQQQEAAVRHQRDNAVKNFLNLGLNEEKYPHVANFYKGRERALVAEADLTAEEYRTLSGGREGSFEDILDFLEDQVAEKANSWYSKKVGAGSKATQAPTPKANSKGKALNPEGSGERRTLAPRDLSGLDADERIEAAKQAVAIAMANSRA